MKSGGAMKQAGATKPGGVTTAGGPTAWFGRRTARPHAAIRLYCFAHSGGSIGEYLRWDQHLPDVEVWGAQLPGRGARLPQPPLTDVTDLVARLLGALDVEPPYALFGHSLGALVAYEVASALRDRGGPAPQRLLLSASAPPHRRPEGPLLHRLPDAELIAEVQRRYGGLAPELAQHPDLIELMLPACRGDFTMSESYRYTPRAPLSSPITVLGGRADTVPLNELDEWRRYTTADFGVHTLPGGHFYFRDQVPAMARLIRAALGGSPVGVVR
jgi:surfactin synthase thioesterase subunit